MVSARGVFPGSQFLPTVIASVVLKWCSLSVKWKRGNSMSFVIKQTVGLSPRSPHFRGGMTSTYYTVRSLFKNGARKKCPENVTGGLKILN